MQNRKRDNRKDDGGLLLFTLAREAAFSPTASHLWHTPEKQNCSSWFATARQRWKLKHRNFPTASSHYTRVLNWVYPRKSTSPFQTPRFYTRSMIPATNKTSTLCTAQENKEQNWTVHVKIHLDIAQVQIWPRVSINTLVTTYLSTQMFPRM